MICMNNLDLSFNYEGVEIISNFLKIAPSLGPEKSFKEQIKEMCVKKLCIIVGISGKCPCKSLFFDFFFSIMGEALCNKFHINESIACDELRLIRFENVNLIREFETYLNEKEVDDAFLEGFRLADKFRYVIDKISRSQ